MLNMVLYLYVRNTESLSRSLTSIYITTYIVLLTYLCFSKNEVVGESREVRMGGLGI